MRERRAVRDCEINLSGNGRAKEKKGLSAKLQAQLSENESIVSRDTYKSSGIRGRGAQGDKGPATVGAFP